MIKVHQLMIQLCLQDTPNVDDVKKGEGGEVKTNSMVEPFKMDYFICQDKCTFSRLRDSSPIPRDESLKLGKAF